MVASLPMFQIFGELRGGWRSRYAAYGTELIFRSTYF